VYYGQTKASANYRKIESSEKKSHERKSTKNSGKKLTFSYICLPTPLLAAFALAA